MHCDSITSQNFLWWYYRVVQLPLLSAVIVLETGVSSVLCVHRVLLIGCAEKRNCHCQNGCFVLGTAHPCFNTCYMFFEDSSIKSVCTWCKSEGTVKFFSCCWSVCHGKIWPRHTSYPVIHIIHRFFICDMWKVSEMLVPFSVHLLLFNLLKTCIYIISVFIFHKVQFIS